MKTRAGLFIFAMALAGGGALKLAFSDDEPVPAGKPKIEPPIQINQSNLLQVLGDYKSWTLVNEKRHHVPDVTAFLCAAPTPDRVGPHNGKFISVYVNPPARQPMLKAKNPVFPQGSVIVKEKYAGVDAKEPELLTVMVKQAAGFNPKSGDWEYFVVAAPKLEITASGKLANCQSCHAPQKSTDYVFRTYLPAEVNKKLR